MRIEAYAKERELRKYEKLVNQMGDLKLPLSTEVKSKIEGLQKEIIEIRKELPTPTKKTKKE